MTGLVPGDLPEESMMEMPKWEMEGLAPVIRLWEC